MEVGSWLAMNVANIQLEHQKINAICAEKKVWDGSVFL